MMMMMVMVISQSDQYSANLLYTIFHHHHYQHQQQYLNICTKNQIKKGEKKIICQKINLLHSFVSCLHYHYHSLLLLSLTLGLVPKSSSQRETIKEGYTRKITYHAYESTSIIAIQFTLVQW